MGGMYEAKSQVCCIREVRRRNGTVLQGKDWARVVDDVRVEVRSDGNWMRPPEGWLMVDAGDGRVDLVEGAQAMTVGELRRDTAMLDAHMCLVLDNGQPVLDVGSWSSPFAPVGDGFYLKTSEPVCTRSALHAFRVATQYTRPDEPLIAVETHGEGSRRWCSYHTVSGVQVVDGRVVFTRNQRITAAGWRTAPEAA